MVPREDGVFGGGGLPLRVLHLYAAMQRSPTGADAAHRHRRRYFLGDYLTLDTRAAGVALQELRSELPLDEEKLALGIIEVRNAKMSQAMRTLTVEREIEPREFSLVAFGSAGPMHAVGPGAGVGHRRCHRTPESGEPLRYQGQPHTDWELAQLRLPFRKRQVRNASPEIRGHVQRPVRPPQPGSFAGNREPATHRPGDVGRPLLQANYRPRHPSDAPSKTTPVLFTTGSHPTARFNRNALPPVCSINDPPSWRKPPPPPSFPPKARPPSTSTAA